MLSSYRVHYEYYVEDEDKAIRYHDLLLLLAKLKIGVKDVQMSWSHVGDITLSVEYCYRRKSSSASIDQVFPQQ